jgi:hypothetical protein
MVESIDIKQFEDCLEKSKRCGFCSAILPDKKVQFGASLVGITENTLG